jgi:peptidoglycan/xylan/chitin deacetylase (PgdA/CDA1 family)
MRGPLAAVNGLRVALYHHLADTPSDLVDQLGVTTPTALFEAHVRRLARDYEIVDVDAVLAGRLPRRALLLTFDDGFRSVADVALPVLARLGLPSVLFVSSAFLDARRLPLDSVLSHLAPAVGPAALQEAIGGPRAPAAGTVRELLAIVATLPYARRVALGDELAERFGVDQAALRAASGLFLDPEDLAGLAEHRCEVGNHTRTHLFCRAIVDAETAERELVSHRAELERLAGAPVRTFSYPYGSRRDATPFVEEALRASGHAASFLVEARRNAPSGAGPAYNRVSLLNKPSWQIGAQLDLLPVLRSVRDRLRPAEVAR